jgi:hypothetical protein
VVARASDELVATVAAAVGESWEAEEAEGRYRAGILAAFRLIAQRPDVRTLLLGEPEADPAVSKASLHAQRSARAAMAALYLSDEAFLAGAPDRERRAEEVAQAGIGVINALAALGIERKVSPEHLTDLAMAVLWPGIDGMRR